MSAPADSSIQTKVYMTEDGRCAIEQANRATVLLSAEEILAVIHELHVCYDYCAAWKEPPRE